MARRKQVAPMQRIDSGEIMQSLPDTPERRAMYANRQSQSQPNGHGSPDSLRKTRTPQSRIPLSRSKPQAGLLQLLICVSGIYASFLTWGLLQERITTTPYHPEPNSLGPAPGVEYWHFPVFLNTIQSFFAFIAGSIYLTTTTPSSSWLPSRAALGPLLIIAITTTLASPFGYASLAHVDYLTFVLAKSCKLLPVMGLHVVLYRKRYPWSKYAIVLAVTAGVAIFSLYHPPKVGKKAKRDNSVYGLALLAVNLLFDGLTNTTQDQVFAQKAKIGKVEGAAMMAVTNFFACLFMVGYLLLTPHIPQSILPAPFASTTSIDQTIPNELAAALAFLHRHPTVLYDVLGFCACGAIGQLFIFATLQRFSSLLLVTVTVTRKMLTMLLSVLWFGKRLTLGQWCGVALVFAGIALEAGLKWVGDKEKGREGKERVDRGRKEL